MSRRRTNSSSCCSSETTTKPTWFSGAPLIHRFALAHRARNDKSEPRFARALVFRRIARPAAVGVLQRRVGKRRAGMVAGQSGQVFEVGNRSDALRLLRFDAEIE